MHTTIILRHDSSDAWAKANPVLRLREPGYDDTANQLKVGNGFTPWNELPYLTLPNAVPPTMERDEEGIPVFTK